jgi:multiple sugar transport system permease protein
VVVFILTRGGPVYYTQVLPVWAWFTGIDGGDLGAGAAVALFLLPVLLVVAILMLRLARRIDVE